MTIEKTLFKDNIMQVDLQYCLLKMGFPFLLSEEIEIDCQPFINPARYSELLLETGLLKENNKAELMLYGILQLKNMEDLCLILHFQ